MGMTQEELLQIIARAKRENATTLNLSGKGLTAVPPEIGKLTSLINLDLSRNQLTAVPHEIFQLSALTRLDLGNNHLTAVPHEIGNLVTLTKLYLWGNHLTAVPPEIGNLITLTKLYLWGNQLTVVPPEIGNLTALTFLNLIKNQLTAVPPEIGNLTALTILDLRDNQLTTVPPELLRLTQLQTLDLRGNPALPIPPEILEQWEYAPAILAYIRQNLVSRPIHEAKLLVLGEAETGKTSLIQRLLGNPHNPHENKTEGIVVNQWQVPLPNTQDTRFLEEIGYLKVNIWDFGGQEIMHATHQFFLTKRSLYLLLFDNRNSEAQNRLEYWLRLIENYAPDSPIILVGNKSDQHPLDLNQRQLRSKYPNIRAILPLSCATGQGLEQLRTVLSYELSQLPHIHDQMPQTWFDLKQLLEKLNRPTLPHREYCDLCHQHKILDELSQETLIRFLHDLGVVLNFRDDPRLQETNILQPHWVTTAVYQILNHPPLLNHALLDLTLLRQILDPIAYPTDKQMYIIDMLQKFELAYPVEGHPHTYLLPNLLPKQQPDLSSFLPTFNSPLSTFNSPLSFQYHYEVLPGSIISRFIVRMNPRIHQNTVWRTGVLLHYRDSLALVRADLEDKIITIDLSGGLPASRRAFLAIIREQFAAIHATLANLRPVEKLALPEYPDIFIEYEDLLSHEADGETTIYIPKLHRRFNVHELLAGIRAQSQTPQELSAILQEKFSLQELELLCHHLGIPTGDLRIQTKPLFVLDILEYMQNNGRLPNLAAYIRQHRPHL